MTGEMTFYENITILMFLSVGFVLTRHEICINFPAKKYVIIIFCQPEFDTSKADKIDASVAERGFLNP
jgi:hypothetical protein